MAGIVSNAPVRTFASVDVARDRVTQVSGVVDANGQPDAYQGHRGVATSAA
jgi:hypothetical protein